MLEAELEGRPAEEAGKPGLAPVADLMAALQLSLEEASEAPRKGPRRALPAGFCPGNRLTMAKAEGGKRKAPRQARAAFCLPPSAFRF
jgi:hypothetical protein